MYHIILLELLAAFMLALSIYDINFTEIYPSIIEY